MSLPAKEMRPASGRWPLIRVAALVIAAVVALPILAVVSSLFTGSGVVWTGLVDRIVSVYVVNTLVLLAGVAVVAGTIGTGTAWLVTMCEFPGRRHMEWLLLLPFAAPAYVVAYAYTDFLEFAGPLQTELRDLTGWGRHDYWFPEIRSTPGAIAMLSLALYPYVYLLGRNAFLSQSVQALGVARSLGLGPWSAFARVAIPMARPGLAAGLALALMETLADFGTVEFFGVQTFTTGIYRTWFIRGSPEGAAQLASILLFFAFAVILVERSSRSRARYVTGQGRFQPLPRFVLAGSRAWAAFLATALPVLLGFVVPVCLLVELTVSSGDSMPLAAFSTYAGNSVLVAGLAAILAVAAALTLGYAARLAAGPVTHGAVRIASMGYAIPGSVIAVGILVPLAWLDNRLDAFMEAAFGVSTGLLVTGSIAALLLAYVVRFLAVAYNSTDAGLARVTPAMDGAARSLGRSPFSTLTEIHAPLLRGSLLTGGLLVFVDVLKELPATLLVRPFNFETLATRTWRLAADERLAEASTAALAIVVAGIVPVIVLSGRIARSRPGSQP